MPFELHHREWNLEMAPIQPFKYGPGPFASGLQIWQFNEFNFVLFYKLV